jgi:hypothetical protein
LPINTENAVVSPFSSTAAFCDPAQQVGCFSRRCVPLESPDRHNLTPNFTVNFPSQISGFEDVIVSDSDQTQTVLEMIVRGVRQVGCFLGDVNGLHPQYLDFWSDHWCRSMNGDNRFKLFPFMLHSLRSRQRIGGSDSTKFDERRIVVGHDLVKTMALSTPDSAQILRAWISNSAVLPKLHRRIESIVFESKSRLIRIESSAFSSSSLRSIWIPSSVEILGSSCFSSGQSLPFYSSSAVAGYLKSAFDKMACHFISSP